MPRGRRPQVHGIQTVGATVLRQLRERAGLTLLEVEAVTEGQIGAAHLQRIESGKTKLPDRGTLVTILAALGTSYPNQRVVLENFGYKAPTGLPTEAEIAAARALCETELATATWPVYLSDCALRLLAWNRYVPRLLGRDPDDPALERFLNCTILDLAFNPDFETPFLIDNPDEFLPALLRLVKGNLLPFQGEAWYDTLISRGMALPGFAKLWNTISDEMVEKVGAHINVPMRIDVPQVGLLSFVLAGSNLVHDPRFVVVHYTPFGVITLRQCALWAEAEGVWQR
ncbi:MAG: helix-turn-helix domain-containing protein [Herpetosiphonaceae bacterium]|nr:helix-turn-helix domain-containing protein [Herpetosiphonaceae bacterium]